MAVVYLLFISSCLLQWSGGNAFVPVVHEPPSSQCGQSDPIEDDQQLMERLKMIHQQLPPPGCNPPLTCIDILRCNSSASSGYYQIQAANGSAVQVYCDMEGTNCGGEGGWMRVAHINMTDLTQQCPANFKLEMANSVRFCIRNTSNAGCRSMIIEQFGFNYTQVCGYVRGYRYGSTDAFGDYGSVNTIVDGVSITAGATHVWTYAAGFQEAKRDPSADPVPNCPCNSASQHVTPSFVGNDYYCESGSLNQPVGIWYTNDPLWDGMQCGGDEGPCCNHTGLPWFMKTLSPTTATLNVDLCVDEVGNENIGVEQFELYIK